MQPSPNHALQRTRAAVTPAASDLRLAPTTQRSRQPRGSLSLGSLGVATRAVRTTLLSLGLIALVLHASGADAPANWKRFLDTPLVDDWQPVFGAALTYPARPAETWAQKLIEFQRVISKSTGGQHIPIYLSPELAATQLPALPEQNRIGVPLSHVPIIEALKFITGVTKTQMTVTDRGILLDLGSTPKPK